MVREQPTICSVCKKRRAAEAPGSLTSFLFQEMRCACDTLGASEESHAAPDLARCTDCGRIALNKAGSFTSFLFQDLGCHCAEGGTNQTRSKNGELLSTRFQRTDKATKVTALGSTRTWRRNDTDAMVKLREDEVIGGYRLIKEIGRGGMGIVFLAEYLTLNRFCALKFLAPSMVSDKSWIMFQNEAKIVAGLNHPTICQIYDMGVHDSKLPFYAMEFLDGESLESVLINQRTLTVGAALEVFAKVAEGLSYAHRHGVVHKDIKPANIMLTPTADGHVAVKILDFGIAELVDSKSAAQQIQPGEVVGSAFYMSPEQLRGTKLDPRSDIYSVGCSLFEALTGEPPFQSQTREALSERHSNEEAATLHHRTGIDFPDELERILQKTLAKSPEDRYQSADQLMEDLEQLLEKKPAAPIDSSLRDTDFLIAEKPPVAAHSGNWGVAVVLLATAAFLGVGYLAVSFWVHSFSNDSEVTTVPTPSKTEEAPASKDSIYSSSVHTPFANELSKAAQRYSTMDARSYVEAGKALSVVDDAKPGLKNLQIGLQLDPTLWNAQVSDCLVKDYVELGQFENALTELDRVLKTFPNHYRYRSKGQVLCQLNRNKEAIACFNKATKLGPAEYWNYYDRGCLYLTMKQYDKALADFTKLISLRPDEAQGYALRSKCYTHLGKPDLADLDLKKAEKLGRAQFD